MQKEKTNWFTSWFDTPYYHILYKDRDYEEASHFMEQLTTFLKLPSNSEILDLACGKGRHSKYLNSLGYRVTGVDLSTASIDHAKEFENDKLKFQVHDMCEPFSQRFDAVFNLFTSFGYFKHEEDNLRTLKAIKSNLKPNGFGVIDFLNSNYVAQNLIPSEIKTIEGITFHIERYMKEGYIYKEIKFAHDSENHHYLERVRALTLDDFKYYLKEANCKLKHCFGDYHLNEFDQKKSERLILIFN